VQAAHDEAHRDNESLLVLMLALKLYWEMTRMILAVVNRKGGTGKTTVATNYGV
jgi:Mrp family chromosome partitioning ATPase